MTQFVSVVLHVARVPSLPMARAVYESRPPALPLHCTAKELTLQSNSAITLSGRQGAVGWNRRSVRRTFQSVVRQFDTHRLRPLPESKVKDAPVLLLHVALEAITTAVYWRPHSSFAEHVVVLEEQDTTWPWVPVIVAV